MPAGECSTTLMREEEAKVGWRGLVVMVKWWGAPIMIVVEPLEVYHLQQELSTSMSYGQVCLRRLCRLCLMRCATRALAGFGSGV